jgi:hypothetical protein
MSGLPCQEGQLGAPEDLSVNVQVIDSVWQGKAMLYLPRWLLGNEGTCATAPSVATINNIYTDFVGDATHATLSLYMIPGGVATVQDFSSYAASKFCDNFTGICHNGQAQLDQNPPSAYLNPTCIAGDAAPTWGSACKSDVAKIATPTYSDASLWLQPQALQTFKVTMPTTVK